MLKVGYLGKWDKIIICIVTHFEVCYVGANY